MVQSRKYEKCITLAKLDRASHNLGREETTYGSRCSKIHNPLCPHETEIVMNMETTTGRPGVPLPHIHAFTETFYWVGTDYNNPYDLGGTVEFWLGQGDEAEGFSTEKPFTCIAPGGTPHTPIPVREVKKPILVVTIVDHPMTARILATKPPTNYKDYRKPGDPLPKLNKYAKNFNPNNISGVPDIPSHKGKTYVALVHDYGQNEMTPHYGKIDMVYGEGIGWGCGDSMTLPDPMRAGVTLTRRSLPVQYPVTATYVFYPIGVDIDHAKNLGGEVEFWIGEGEEAEQYIITKPTFVFIPPNTVHMPIYVKDIHKPYGFAMITILDTPLWAGVSSQKFPTTFEHIVEVKK
jgi:hypothetical protein